MDMDEPENSHKQWIVGFGVLALVTSLLPLSFYR